MLPTENALAHLRRRVPELPLERGAELETDLFLTLAKGIVGRSGAFAFAWALLESLLGEVSPERVREAGASFRSGRIGVERLSALSDDKP